MRESSLNQFNTDQLQPEAIQALVAQVHELSANLQPKQPEEYLTRQDVAKLLKVNISTVSNWKNDGVINAYGIGGRVYYKRSEIDKAMIKIN
ncbi:helix-turn-helix domain-containing protein [Flavobacterium sp. WC2421]|uniref:helix-turn-helix domain-containing protein n=1 Tax=unclassified Flavobacterium TaxID=196869 RepID=UPI0034656CFD